ncbi:MAG: shikimate dehydrogenase [Gammaproteobacteria bacterium]|nr:shikimate dehydrogenase [Gammaproteobacteria bacterium]
MTERYAVFGNPIGHSRSPAIHTAFAAATGQDLVYEAIAAPLDGFADALADFAARGGRGANVTLPFKEEAAALCMRLSERARLAGAVNTLLREGEGWLGDNTDGAGLAADLAWHGLAVGGKRVLIHGAGGAVRGILGPLLALGPAELVIANRTHAKAEALARAFSPLGPVRAVALAGFAEPPFDLLINASSAGLAGELPALPAGVLAPGAGAYDLLYGEKSAPFLAWARAMGAAQAVDGWGMLLEQAAEAFALWRGVRPDTAALRV